MLSSLTTAEFSTVHICGSCNVPLPLLAPHGEKFTHRLPGQVVLKGT
ncbi:hypothetical protein [Dietzia sp. SYD-A1]|nr:hypothetical protein [Dietzia sp. SYD-A1]